MSHDLFALPDDVVALQAAVIAACVQADAVAPEPANEQARRADDAALLAHMKLQSEKLKRDKFGPSSERMTTQLSKILGIERITPIMDPERNQAFSEKAFRRLRAAP